MTVPVLAVEPQQRKLVANAIRLRLGRVTTSIHSLRRAFHPSLHSNHHHHHHHHQKDTQSSTQTTMTTTATPAQNVNTDGTYLAVLLELKTHIFLKRQVLQAMRRRSPEGGLTHFLPVGNNKTTRKELAYSSLRFCRRSRTRRNRPSRQTRTLPGLQAWKSHRLLAVIPLVIALKTQQPRQRRTLPMRRRMTTTLTCSPPSGRPLRTPS